MATKQQEFLDRLPHRLQIGKHVIYPCRELSITHHHGKELERQPGLYAWYGSLHAQAVFMWQNAKQDVLEREEDLQEEYKKEHPKCKEADAKLYAKTDSRLRSLWRRQTTLNKKRNEMFFCLQAVEQRGHLLQTLCANRRLEMRQPDAVRGHNFDAEDT